MDINAAFSSNFLKASDLQGRPQIVAMNYVQSEKAGEDTKPCLYFQGKKLGLLLNKTNANTIQALFGSQTESWSGQQIEIYPTTTDYQGRRVDCIRVRAVGVNVGSPAYQGGVQNTQQAPVANTPQPDPFPGDLDDEIPF